MTLTRREATAASDAGAAGDEGEQVSPEEAWAEMATYRVEYRMSYGVLTFENVLRVETARNVADVSGRVDPATPVLLFASDRPPKPVTHGIAIESMTRESATDGDTTRQQEE